MSIPQTQKDEQGKIIGHFYPIQRAEIVALRKQNIINNAGYVHLAFRYENPYYDRPVEILPKEFAKRWEVPESSVYQAIQKLKETEAIRIKYGKVIIEWIQPPQPEELDQPEDPPQPEELDQPEDPSQTKDPPQPEEFVQPNNEIVDSQQVELNDNLDPIQDVISESELSLVIMDCHKSAPIVISDYENSEKDIYKDRARAQTSSDLYSDFIKTLSEDEREEFEKFVRVEWRKRTARNGEPGEEIISMERFLSRKEDLKNWRERFLNSSVGREAKQNAIANKYDWLNDPRFTDWINKAYWGGYPWAQEDEAEREERNAFLRWAQQTNAYEGRVSHDIT